ncbi:MAG: hypothetical protein JXL80_00060 [Planctomycetes bacterium]|nr:hypothetical protein [Planctomycetota bacterium]
MRCRSALGVSIVLLLSTPAAMRGDTIVLKDGRTFEGQTAESGDTIAVFTKDGMKSFRREEIERIEPDLLKQADAQTRAAFNLTRKEALRRNTAAEAVAVWEKYVADNPEGLLLPRAREELDRWRQADEKGQVIWFGKAMSPQERDRTKAEVYELIDSGLEQIEAKDFAKAKRDLIRAESLWTDHPTANFYLGQVWRGLRNPITAARHYDAVVGELPDHVPALNNCACVCAQVKDYRTGVTYLARAIRRDDQSDVLADNAWEMLHMLEVDKQGPGLRLDFFKVSIEDLKTLEDACRAQQERMKAKDKFRWGSRWISGLEHANLLSEQADADRRLAELASQIKALDAEISRMEDRLDTLARMRNQLIKAGTDAKLWTYHREVKELQEDIQDRRADRAELVKDAKDINKRRPEPEWSHNLVLLPATNPLEGLSGKLSDDADVRDAVFSLKAVLVAHDGTFLGRLTAARHDTESIWNPLGEYGSRHSATSIFDPSSRFGGKHSDESPWNPAATKPPVIKVNDTQVAYLTANSELKPAVTVEDLVTTLRQSP